ncbi:Ig-like domain-containing protein [Cystobacter fuscus]
MTLLVDGIDAGSIQADARGAWRRQPEVPLPWGTHRVSVSATDRAGNVSPLPPEVPFLTSRRGAYRLGCSADPSSWQGCWPWALVVLGLLRPRSRS